MGGSPRERAFSFRELCDLAVRAGWQNFSAEKFSFARQVIWLEREQPNK